MKKFVLSLTLAAAAASFSVQSAVAQTRLGAAAKEKAPEALDRVHEAKPGYNLNWEKLGPRFDAKETSEAWKTSKLESTQDARKSVEALLKDPANNARAERVEKISPQLAEHLETKAYMSKKGDDVFTPELQAALEETRLDKDAMQSVSRMLALLFRANVSSEEAVTLAKGVGLELEAAGAAKQTASNASASLLMAASNVSAQKIAPSAKKPGADKPSRAAAIPARRDLVPKPEAK
jgi:hypothetical protein